MPPKKYAQTLKNYLNKVGAVLYKAELIYLLVEEIIKANFLSDSE